jgi:Na+/glutamate symporter
MKTFLFATLGFFGGLAAAYGVALVWNPGSYEDAIPLLCVGTVVGPIVGIVLARRGRKVPSDTPGSP